ncbi:effector-associated domain 2-containing protein [Saccharopolyspora flava]|uniref:SEFIR domain-containing protein n=1 Tax=Saccharopolyspora flava TaxID=95161 RepID=A0A1I6SL48_9PSEU|nr:SEFIR domain-containing protein [Saccharopolyspora flava]SFS77498.1 SEFIR domain-containing protein [Saccharopolyspora flava]
MPRVFVSYAHDSEAHMTRVREFATFLRVQGVDAELDRWDNQDRRDWLAWAIDEMRKADFVLVIASPMFARMGDGSEPSGRHRGIQAEAALLRELLHRDRKTWFRKVLPVVLPGGDLDGIPLFLQPYSASHYFVHDFTPAGAEQLLRTLGGDPEHPSPPLGGVAGEPAPVLSAESAPVKTFELVDALLKVPAVAEDDSRRVLLGLLRPEIRNAIPHHARTRAHVINIARTCRDYEGGLGDLVRALEELEGDSMPVRRVRELVQRAGMSG